MHFFLHLRKAKKKLPREVYLLARYNCLMFKLIVEIRVYICHKNMKSRVFFLQFFESFRGKIYNIYSTGNEEWIESETAAITIDYALIITWAFHKLTCRQNKCTPKKQTILSFFFTSEIYRDFSWATVLKRLLTAPVFHNRFLIAIYIFDDSSDPFKTENGHHSINLTDDVCSPSKPDKAGSLLERCI